MHLTEGEIYHVFNRGNNKQEIFLSPENYSYFLQGAENYVKPVCDILAWCLMPNHFHLLIHANSNSILTIKDGSFERQQFSQAIKQWLSSYTKAINKREKRTGSLFQQKTKAVSVSYKTHDAQTAFQYIHQNPLKAGLVEKIEQWKHSSFNDYMNLQKASLCNRELAIKLIDINMDRFYQDSYQVINFKQEQE